MPGLAALARWMASLGNAKQRFTQPRFTKQQRLLTPAQFQRVFDHTEAKASTKTLLLLASGNHTQTARIGFVIAKKNVRTAVQRNRIKRVLREAFRLHQADLPPLDIVILARKGIDELSNRELHEAFLYLCRKLAAKLK